jgi:ubiquinone/menaquinone biosynthesis C-methylase UbiE
MKSCGAVSAPPRRWNHNTHYHPLILGAVPDGCRRSLDVGCGEGMLTRDLRRVVPHVTGIDRDAASIDVARRQDAGGAVEYVVGDFMTHPFAPASFDHIASIAALHHMDETAALERMRALLAPGGTLAIIGLARNRYPADLAVSSARASSDANRACFVTPLGRRDGVGPQIHLMDEISGPPLGAGPPRPGHPPPR